MSEEKIALVTGVSRETGLGLETARQLEKLGFLAEVFPRWKTNNLVKQYI
jgi:NAD(P)-dependent dehydrogenase (short-subunit alcohol dehydrogenase family)